MRHKRNRYICVILLLAMLAEALPVSASQTQTYYQKAKAWALEQGIVTAESVLQQPCTRGMLAVLLWAAKKMPEPGAAYAFTDASGYILTAEQWAAANRIMTPDGDSTFGTYRTCTRQEVAISVWLAAGAPDGQAAYFSDVAEDDTAWRAVNWVSSKHVIDGYTAGMFAPNGTCTGLLAAAAVYRAFIGTATREWFSTAGEYWANGAFSAEYDGTSSNANEITREQFIAAVANTWRTAHENGYIYGSSGTLPPTADGRISCDRLIAKALWDLGFTDQTRGGITVGNMIPYLQSHGFLQSSSFSDIGYGSIVIVKGGGKSRWSHTFVTLNFDPSSMSGFKFDCGTNGRIQSEQPTYEGWGYQTDILVFNIPEN